MSKKTNNKVKTVDSIVSPFAKMKLSCAVKWDKERGGTRDDVMPPRKYRFEADADALMKHGAVIKAQNGNEWVIKSAALRVYIEDYLVDVEGWEPESFTYTYSLCGKTKERSFTVSLKWEVAKDYEVRAKSSEEAKNKILEILNRGDICVWTDGFEATDNIKVTVRKDAPLR